MTPNKEYFASYTLFNEPEKVHLGCGRIVEAVGVGSINLKMSFIISHCKLATMYNVLHVCNFFRYEQPQRGVTKFSLIKKNVGFEGVVVNCLEWEC